MMTSEVTHRSLVPGVTDPSIWMVRVKLGLEQQLVRSIMFKALKAKAEGKKVGLKSVFCTSSKSYIYLESHEETSARQALMGLSGIYISTFQLVPISEMTALLTIRVKKKPLKSNQWVRMKRGPLKGDLAKVLSVSEGGESAVIQAVPRIDYSARAADGKSQRLGHFKLFLTLLNCTAQDTTHADNNFLELVKCVIFSRTIFIRKAFLSRRLKLTSI